MTLDLGTLLNLLGSLGLFLYGMKVMSDALMALAGKRMRKLMAELTANRFKGMLTGLLITGLVQSSSATTLMVVSFVNAGLLKLVEAISVIMGANIGTTFTAWLITLLGFKVSMSSIALPLMTLAFVFYMRRNPTVNQWGRLLAGFALLFIGLDFMKGAIPDLHDNPRLYEIIREWSEDGGFTSTLIFVGIGTLLTLILQSSSATMAITLVAASQGWLPFSAAAAMVLGENIGTTITANMAALVANIHARRAALAHLIFNLFGVIWILLLFQPVLQVVNTIASQQGALPLIHTDDIPIGLAIFHSFFNIANMLILIGFVAVLAKIVERLLPEPPASCPVGDEPLYLKKNLLKYPETGIAALQHESQHLFDHAVHEAIAHSMNLHRHDIKSDLPPQEVAAKSREVIELDLEQFVAEHIQPIYSEIIEFSVRLQERHQLTPEQQSLISDIRHANRDLLVITSHIAALSSDLQHYMDSDNNAIQYEYDRLRALLVSTMRRLEEAAHLEKYNQRRNAFSALYRDIKKHDRHLVSEIDGMIREKKITSHMGANLISSSAILKRLSKDLVKVARFQSKGQEYYHKHDSNQPDIEELMELAQ
jgi:phosphate:Na+ symporter